MKGPGLHVRAAAAGFAPKVARSTPRT